MAIDPALLAAYCATSYRVWLPQGMLGLRVGKACLPLDAYVRAQGATAWMIVTAYNPASSRLCEAENRLRQESLVAQLQACGLPTCPSENVADSGDWPVEPGYFVTAPGLTREVARNIGRKAEQNAVLFGTLDPAGRRGSVPEILWCQPAVAAEIDQGKHLSP